MDTEAALVKRARNGDQQAFAQLIELEQHRLYTLAVRELGSTADAEDAVQEALIRAWRALPRFRAESRFSTWIYRIQLNAIHDQRAKRARGAGAPLEDVPEPVDPRDAIYTSELSSALQDALNSLDETYRTAVLMSDVSGMSYGEIATVIGIAEGTVKSRIFRGRAELARLLGTSVGAPESNL